MKICLVSNKPDIKENYSKFIDSCDKIVRVNKMDNVDTGLTGSRTDIVFTVLNSYYFRYSRKWRHVDILRTAKVYFIGAKLHDVKNYVEWESLRKDYQIITPDFIPYRWTATSITLKYLYDNFPEAQIYYLGDIEREKRTTSAWHNQPQVETSFFLSLIEKGKLVSILGNKDYYEE